MPHSAFANLPPLPFLVISALLAVVLFIFMARLKSTKRELENSKQETEKASQTLADYEMQYSGIINVDKEIEVREHASKVRQDEANAVFLEVTNDIEQLKSSYKEKKGIYDSLIHKIGIYDDDVELLELGFYEPHFDFDTAEQFKEKIRECKDFQKDLLRMKDTSGAIYCTTEWTVGNSKVEGKKMTDRGIRLTARAFNNECEAAIANCTWKNVVKMEARINKAFEAINKLNESNMIVISNKYLQLKVEELRLTHEHREKKQAEKEEQAEIKAQMRGEAKIEAEIKKAEQEAIREEARFSKALVTARKQLESANDEARSKLEEQIAQLQSDLEAAEQKHQRAQSMAEQTKQGHVYVISNIGSFGENVYKIGMTRRLEPMDRVKELGDASVPFSFDVHAMIHTTDAPSLEKELHRVFDNNRLNMVNRRKEFFQVDLSDIKKAVKNFDIDDAEFIETAVAQDFNETRAMRKQAELKEAIELGAILTKTKQPEFAESI
ncbi:DUF4041 domain-containing protein [Vibrio ezurae]|uniref:Bacteriophage T5 Orf172 DNA-binding domain-containing protein n=1 Tax=Vibrio ezurae NBRC 102218 TaxID=1219080 RepID=U3B5I3_9VIBR|nr:DUF4041 domain-containing protein [Vibrio ezurae]GAD81195.1 hypothetical protein VEZ01S_52_00530 [Vibrio ezurae NBRC 102218]